jgi:hypothetical protein
MFCRDFLSVKSSEAIAVSVAVGGDSSRTQRKGNCAVERTKAATEQRRCTRDYTLAY